MATYFSALSLADRKVYEATLGQSHEAHTAVWIWDRNRDSLGPVNYVLDGQVDLNGVTRTCTMSFGDPKDHWKIGTNLVFLDRVLRVERWVRVVDLGIVVRVPMFTGPVVKADENGGVVSLEAHGFEEWLSGDIKQVHRFGKGRKVTGVIQALLSLGGVDAKHMTIPARGDRLGDAFQVGPQYEGGIWAAVTYLADTINCDLYPNGAGVFELKHRPAPVAFEFHGGAGGTVMGQPQKSTLIGPDDGDATSVVNDVIRFGTAKPVKPPKNPPPGYKPPKEPAPRGEAIAKRGSTFGPDQLGFPAADFYAKDVATLEHCRTTATLKRIAEEALKRFTSAAAAVSFDSAPVPHLDPYDRIKVDVPGYAGTYYLSQFSIPFNFTESSPMTVGYRKLVHQPAPRHHR